MASADSELIVVGKITVPFGIKGWVKVYSYTDPLTNILDFAPWYIEVQHDVVPYVVLEGRQHGKGIVARLKGVDDRNAAELLRNYTIRVKREQLPTPAEGEVYWVDLIGLQVISLECHNLGIVDDVFATGANDVLVVKQGDEEFLIPYVDDIYIKEVDLDAKTVRVDWDPDF